MLHCNKEYHVFRSYFSLTIINESVMLLMCQGGQNDRPVFLCHTMYVCSV